MITTVDSRLSGSLAFQPSVVFLIQGNHSPFFICKAASVYLDKLNLNGNTIFLCYCTLQLNAEDKTPDIPKSQQPSWLIKWMNKQLIYCSFITDICFFIQSPLLFYFDYFGMCIKIAVHNITKCRFTSCFSHSLIALNHNHF